MKVSMFFKKLNKCLQNPNIIGIMLLGLKINRFLPDKNYLSLLYRLKMNKRLNLLGPSTFNEKLQWLKLHDRNSLYTDYVDKYKVRGFIEKTIGKEYLVPLLGIYNKVEDIDFSLLPNQFVLKPTHTSGNVIICRDKTKLDIIEIKKTLNKWLKREYYWNQREWPYKNVKPRIICEELLVDESGYELKDYKFYCFHGEPKFIQVMSNRKGSNYDINHFDINWNELEIERKNHGKNQKEINRPHLLDDMVRISKKLSGEIPFVRVDLYYTGEKIYFGEMTFFPASGYIDYVKESDDLLHGSWLDLSLVEKNQKEDANVWKEK